VPDILPRRRVLAASAAALPVLLVTAGCRSSEVFAGPDPLAGRPTPSPGVITLQAVIAAEQDMIALYQAAVSSNLRTPVVGGLLAQHRQHLVHLRAQLVVPPGTSVGASGGASGGGSVGASGGASASASPTAGPGRMTIARLRAAERASAADLVGRLAAVPPALAQLFASIAASDATHAVALGG
jgi:hypothetical protein